MPHLQENVLFSGHLTVAFKFRVKRNGKIIFQGCLVKLNGNVNTVRGVKLMYGMAFHDQDIIRV
jgi:hypothetical protein